MAHPLTTLQTIHSPARPGMRWALSLSRPARAWCNCKFARWQQERTSTVVGTHVGPHVIYVVRFS